MSLVESNFNFTAKIGRLQTYSQRNHYVLFPMQDRMCRCLALRFWGVVHGASATPLEITTTFATIMSSAGTNHLITNFFFTC
jgi:hypothetical protein